jgi:mono/diheme cytochrome c family protein
MGNSSQAAPDAPDDPEAIGRAAAALFRVSCAGCHGDEGRGGGSALPPGITAPDMTAASFHDERSDEALAQVIRDGRGAMPGFGSQINDRGIAALVGHVRTLRGAPAGE